MDLAIVIAVMILAFITVLELVNLFRSKSCSENILDFAAVIPVFPTDDNLSTRLNCLNEKIACGHCHAEEIILINYGALPEQLEICRNFCNENRCAIIADSSEIEKILSKTFAIDMKT